MRKALQYRGDVLPDVAGLTDTEIADRIRHMAEVDRQIQRLLNRYGKQHAGDVSAGAALGAMRSWLDLGLASMAVAEHRQEVAVFTRHQRT